MYGNPMRLHKRETVAQIPGTGQTSRDEVQEWICPDCDYFEEIDGEVVED